MRSVEEIDRDARPEMPFSNSDHGEWWMGRWCWTPCAHDVAFQRNQAVEGCPLVLIALCGKTPAEWIRDGSDYHCIEYRPESDGDDEPAPTPEPMPGQEELIPADEYRGTRMYRDVVDELRHAEVPA